MAELPELEVYAEMLRPLLTGRTLTGVEVHYLRVLRREAPERFAAKLTGQRIKDVVRRGKTLAFLLGGGDRRQFFKVHHRGGKPCPRCGGKIASEEFRERPTNWCPACQR